MRLVVNPALSANYDKRLDEGVSRSNKNSALISQDLFHVKHFLFRTLVSVWQKKKAAVTKFRAEVLNFTINFTGAITCEMLHI